MQEEKKTFWKKYETVIVIAVTLLFIFILVFFNQKINFFLGNELILHLTTDKKSFNMHYGETGSVNFDISIDNFAACRASCTFTFTDKGKNEVMDYGTFQIKRKEIVSKDYGLEIKRLGSGQDIYTFDVRCHSIRTLLCLTGSPEKVKSELITVNYDLTDTEKEIKEKLKQNVTRFLELLKHLDVKHQEVNNKYFELGSRVNLLNISHQKIALDDLFDRTRISIENLRSLWSEEDYLTLNELFNSSSAETINEIESRIQDLDDSINNLIDIHNSLLSSLEKTGKNIQELNDILTLGENNYSDLSKNIIIFNEISSSVVNNTFENYGGISSLVHELEALESALVQKSGSAALKIFFHYDYTLNYEQNILCSLLQNCAANASVENTIKNSENFLDVYPDSSFIGGKCASLDGLRKEYLNTENINFNNTENIRAKVTAELLASFDEIIRKNQISQETIGAAQSVLSDNSLSNLSGNNISDHALNLLGGCNKQPRNQLQTFDFTPISKELNHNFTSLIDTELSENPPVCCIFNECKPCCRDDSCRNDPETFPVVFVHGHSFIRGYSPEFSLDAFNRMQLKLEEQGYLNAGIVSLYSKNEPLQEGVWSLSGRPVSVKISYYFDTFREEDEYIVVPTKSENIDTYAVRLKDLLEIIKSRTNKPKVNIISYSMGGLVTRRYMQIFGEDDINKLIMIATPNKGIAGKVGNFCGVVGENRECLDMLENSLFINKVNDPSKQPKNVKIYTISGQGCKTGSGDGDGIILKSHVQLDSAENFFVDGICGGVFGEILHTELLDIEKYPETFTIVTEILKE